MLPHTYHLIVHCEQHVYSHMHWWQHIHSLICIFPALIHVQCHNSTHTLVQTHDNTHLRHTLCASYQLHVQQWHCILYTHVSYVIILVHTFSTIIYVKLYHSHPWIQMHALLCIHVCHYMTHLSVHTCDWQIYHCLALLMYVSFYVTAASWFSTQSLIPTLQCDILCTCTHMGHFIPNIIHTYTHTSLQHHVYDA